MNTISHPQYYLSWTETNHHWELELVTPAPFHHTSHFPETVSLLDNHLPSILECECFNTEGLPFHQEVKATEMGHLFEHIILEHLCDDKLATGHSSADFSGRTYWDWATNAIGTFHIKISKDQTHLPNFSAILDKSLGLLNSILASSCVTAPGSLALPG
jgi:hypothetical protein